MTLKQAEVQRQINNLEAMVRLGGLLESSVRPYINELKKELKQ